MVEKRKVLLICDDLRVSKHFSEHLNSEGYAVVFEPTSKAGLEAFKEEKFDVVIAKIGISDINTGTLINGLRKIDPDCVIIAYIEDTSHIALEDFSRLQVYDFVGKPVNYEKLFFLIKKAIELRAVIAANRKLSQGMKEQNIALEKQNILLAKRIEDSAKNLTKLYEDLRSTYMRTIKALAHAIEARDSYTHSHSGNVAKYAVTIAQQMKLSAKEVETMRLACELHDLGKIGIVDSILTKPSSLSEDEWRQIKFHPQIAVQILEPLTFLNEVIPLIKQHHEHFDGSGYPEGRKGEDILLGSRIIHLADAYEAMRSARAYRKIPLSKEEAVAEIKKNSGKQFDPKVVEAFLKVLDKLD